MRQDPSTVGRGLEEHDHSPDGGGPPTEAIEHDPWSQPLFDIEAANRVIDRGELRLHLDDQRRGVRRAGRQNVDRPTIAVFVERDLYIDVPAGALESSTNCADELGVALVEQSIDRATSPREPALVARLDDRADGANGSHREAGEMAALEKRYE